MRASHSKLILLKPVVVDVPIVPIKQQYEGQQRLGWLYLIRKARNAARRRESRRRDEGLV
jgi:hypothetical protein